VKILFIKIHAVDIFCRESIYNIEKLATIEIYKVQH
jgi:hypothetical protein